MVLAVVEGEGEEPTKLSGMSGSLNIDPLQV